MQQEFLMLADGAEATNGKIFILGGGIDRHASASFDPAAQLQADIACSVLVEWGEANRTFAVALKMVDEDEHTAVALEFTMETGRPPGAKPGPAVADPVGGPRAIPHPASGRISARDGIERRVAAAALLFLGRSSRGAANRFTMTPCRSTLHRHLRGEDVDPVVLSHPPTT